MTGNKADHEGRFFSVMTIFIWRGAVLLIVPIAFGLYSIHLGRDANWDLQNYHWYDPYALLNWRYDRDVAPAMGMSFFSPLLYLPWLEHVPAG